MIQTTPTPALTPSESAHRFNRRATTTIAGQLGFALAAVAVVCVFAPALVAGLSTVLAVGPLMWMTARAQRLERLSAPRV